MTRLYARLILPSHAALVGWLAALAVGLGSSCYFADGGSDQPGADPEESAPLFDGHCIADEECMSGEICIEGFCSIEPPGSTIEYGIELNPRNDAPVPPHRLDAAPRSVFDAQLRAETATEVSGQIDTGDGEPAPDGTLVIEPVDDQHDSLQLQQPVRNGEFELLAPAGDLQVTLIADDDNWPRLDLGVHNLADAGDTIRLEVPELDELPAVSGELTRQPVELLDVNQQPVEGAEVFARGADSGLLSGTDRTDSDGQFHLRLPPGDDSFDVVVRPGPHTPLVPHANFSEVLEDPNDPLELSLGDLDLTESAVSLDIDAEPTEGAGDPDWSDVRVELHRSVDTGEISVFVEPDAPGVVETELPPGTYDVDVTTSPGSPWGSTTEQLEVLAATTSTEIQLPAREQLEGTVADKAGNELPEVRLEFRSRSGGDHPQVVHTDANGEFNAWVDPGEYSVTVDPPAASGLPIVDRSLEVASAEQNRVDIELPRGLVATGGIATDDGQPVDHARVRAFVGDDRNIAATALTESDGSYRLVLPPSSVDSP